VLNSIFVRLKVKKKAEKQAFLTTTLVCIDRVMFEDIFARVFCVWYAFSFIEQGVCELKMIKPYIISACSFYSLIMYSTTLIS